ncbi:TIGR00730 family Rossman fold protein [Legionella parisiensis]|uniref:Cytokinin riboside 5'-monophosphate phosphoribohydrolase n=1 Tax=Legionella parisiensis TaxID=45071 RepID=A0A1E5JUM4_9GAMM|nr:TIGR00730 family Rossman fold protein [Legionella parisiensis]KTD40834.1 lysine decarboxylase [Legionella parisiensis]OEH48185.1 LOG family protein YvdD [Legionella parisiensis]STX72224.1 lysine decarboxylase [Legionella parisiensis]
MKTVCVYLGAQFGNDNEYSDAAILLGKKIAADGFTLVYGGSSLGMMGLLANTVKEYGGRVVGIITNHLIEQEKPLKILDELHIVDSMQQRKAIMQKISDMFVVMPGGLGTLEEAIETWNAIKIGELIKPIGFLNIKGYFDGLFSFVNSCEHAGFLSSNVTNIPISRANIQLLWNEMLDHYKAANSASVSEV